MEINFFEAFAIFFLSILHRGIASGNLVDVNINVNRNYSEFSEKFLNA